MKSKNFSTLFPKTKSLLDSATRDTFAAYSVGVVSPTYPEIFSHGGACGEKSLFDLASLTKVLCTTTLCALAEEKKILSIHDPVQNYIPDFLDPRVQLSHLLNHTSGLPAWLDLHSHFHDPTGLGSFDARKTPAIAREFYQSEILKSYDKNNFEKQAVYSDLGFLLLGWALENATHTPLDALFQEWIAYPLALGSLQFLPVSPDVVPTENCPWRGHVLRGEVHDDNCYVLGGVAAHAGLFGNIEEVIRLARLWLDALTGIKNDEFNLNSEIVQRYWTFSHLPDTTRVLGWDKVSELNSSAGRYFSQHTRGHLGFTGTSLWIDPHQKIIVSLLTNRVHPSRTNEKIKAFRPIFHDTLLSELGILNS